MPFSEHTPSQAVDTATDLLGPWFRTLARSVRTGVVLLDAGGAPVFANAAASELLGLPTGGEERGHLARLKEVLPPDPGRAAGGSEVLEVETGSPGGKRRILLRPVPLEDEHCGTLLLVEDRTGTAALQASLVLAGRLQTDGYLSAQIHDLKAPLNALALHLELLRRSLEEDETGDHDARDQHLAVTDVLEREIQRLGRSLDSLLRRATSRGRGRSGLQRLDVRRPIRETARLVRETARSAGVRLRTSVPKTAIHALAEADLLKQALLNLVLNAIEAQGGSVLLRAESAGRHVRILVQDDGPGIPEELRDRVFEMSFTTKEHGTGIGLTVARSLVDAQGGSLRLDSRPGDGTTIEILLDEAGSDD